MISQQFFRGFVKYFQILSYLRAGKQNKKKKKDKLGNIPSHLDPDPKASSSGPKLDDIPLYDDVGDYVPSLKKDEKRRDDRKRDRDRNRDRRDKDDDKSR